MISRLNTPRLKLVSCDLDLDYCSSAHVQVRPSVKRQQIVQCNGSIRFNV